MQTAETRDSCIPVLSQGDTANLSVLHVPNVFLRHSSGGTTLGLRSSPTAT